MNRLNQLYVTFFLGCFIKENERIKRFRENESTNLGVRPLEWLHQYLDVPQNWCETQWSLKKQTTQKTLIMRLPQTLSTWLKLLRKISSCHQYARRQILHPQFCCTSTMTIKSYSFLIYSILFYNITSTVVSALVCCLAQEVKRISIR